MISASESVQISLKKLNQCAPAFHPPKRRPYFHPDVREIKWFFVICDSPTMCKNVGLLGVDCMSDFAHQKCDMFQGLLHLCDHLFGHVVRLLGRYATSRDFDFVTHGTKAPDTMTLRHRVHGCEGETTRKTNTKNVEIQTWQPQFAGEGAPKAPSRKLKAVQNSPLGTFILQKAPLERLERHCQQHKALFFSASTPIVG